MIVKRVDYDGESGGSPSRSIHLAANRRPNTQPKIFHRCDNVRRTASRNAPPQENAKQADRIGRGQSSAAQTPIQSALAPDHSLHGSSRLLRGISFAKATSHDYAEIATLGHVTRARVTQIMTCGLLAPEIQEELSHIGSSDQCDAILLA